MSSTPESPRARQRSADCRRRHAESAGSPQRFASSPNCEASEARELAISLLRERAYEFVTATGRLAGLPELGPGDNLEIYGLGRRFSGTYFVKRVEHTLSASGFFTQFTARRVYDGGTQ